MAKTDLGQELVKLGRVDRARADVLENLKARFGTVPAALRQRIEGIAEESRLTALLRRAATVPDLASFEREL